MPGPLPSAIADHALNFLQGYDPLHSLQNAAPMAAAVTLEAYTGRVVHLNASGEYEMGVSGTQMGIFLIPSDSDPDVTSPTYSRGGKFMSQAPAGRNASGIVATGGFEIETTEFDAEPAVAYAPNQLLTAKASNTDQATGGVLSNDRNGAGGSAGAVRAYQDAACGVVSSGVSYNEHQQRDMLSLWTIYLPASSLT